MTALVAPAPTERAEAEIGTTHLVCCHDHDLAMCGEDLTDEPWDEDNPNECVVCVALAAAEDALPDGEWCACPCCVPIPEETRAS